MEGGRRDGGREGGRKEGKKEKMEGGRKRGRERGRREGEMEGGGRERWREGGRWKRYSGKNSEGGGAKGGLDGRSTSDMLSQKRCSVEIFKYTSWVVVYSLYQRSHTGKAKVSVHSILFQEPTTNCPEYSQAEKWERERGGGHRTGAYAGGPP